VWWRAGEIFREAFAPLLYLLHRILPAHLVARFR
jgi:hypothetical protein